MFRIEALLMFLRKIGLRLEHASHTLAHCRLRQRKLQVRYTSSQLSRLFQIERQFFQSMEIPIGFLIVALHTEWYLA